MDSAPSDFLHSVCTAATAEDGHHRGRSMSRRQNILRRAAELFASRGVGRTSMEDISEAVGIKREGVYYYFKNRNDILVEIILAPSKSLLKNLQRLMRTEMSGIQKLHDAIEIHLDAYTPSYIELSIALKEDHFAVPDTKLAQLKRIWATYDDLWIKLIAEGQASGEFKSDLNPKMAAYALLGMCNWVSRWYSPHKYKTVTIQQIVETFFSIASTGLIQNPGSKKAAKTPLA